MFEIDVSMHEIIKNQVMETPIYISLTAVKNG